MSVSRETLLQRIFERRGRVTLTAWEKVALETDVNLADGHAHGSLLAQVANPPEVLERALNKVHFGRQSDHETDFLAAYSRLSGQSHSLAEVAFHYSSSLSMFTVGAALAMNGRQRVGLVHPTFDSLSALLNSSRLETIPIRETVDADADYRSYIMQDLDAIVLVSPNNPTGRCVIGENFRHLIADCRANDVWVILDSSFRLLDERTCVEDQHRTARECDGLEYVFIEDTGKAIPAYEQKVGFVSGSRTFMSAVVRVSEDFLLNVSPLTLRLLESVMEGVDASAPFYRSVVVSNRKSLRRYMRPLGMQLVWPGSRVSVEMLEVPGADAQSLVRQYAENNLLVLPGPQFYWADPSFGRSQLRVALMRSSTYFMDALRVLQKAHSLKS